MDFVPYFKIDKQMARANNGKEKPDHAWLLTHLQRGCAVLVGVMRDMTAEELLKAYGDSETGDKVVIPFTTKSLYVAMGINKSPQTGVTVDAINEGEVTHCFFWREERKKRMLKSEYEETRLLFNNPWEEALFWVPACLPTNPHTTPGVGILTHPGPFPYKRSQNFYGGLQTYPPIQAPPLGVGILAQSQKSCAWAPLGG